MSSADGKFIVYLPKGGRVTLKAAAGAYAVHWIQADSGTAKQADVKSNGGLTVEAPDGGNWVAAVLRR